MWVLGLPRTPKTEVVGHSSQTVWHGSTNGPGTAQNSHPRMFGPAVPLIGANLSVLGSIGRHQSSQFLAEPGARSGLLMGSLPAFAREQIALEQRQAALKMLAGPSTPQEHGQILQALLCEEPIAHYPLLSGFILFQVCFIPITLGKPGELRELLTHPKLLLFLQTPHNQLQLHQRAEMIPVFDRDPMPVQSLFQTLED